MPIRVKNQFSENTKQKNDRKLVHHKNGPTHPTSTSMLEVNKQH